MAAKPMKRGSTSLVIKEMCKNHDEISLYIYLNNWEEIVTVSNADKEV